MTQLQATTEEQLRHIAEILGAELEEWHIGAYPIRTLQMEEPVSFDAMAAIIDYLRSENKPKKGALDLSIVSEEMKDAVETWLAYKKEKGQTYKPMGFKTFYKRLCELSGGNPHIAMQIVENSMQNNYAGIFPLNNNHQPQTNGREERAKDAADLVSRLLAENNA